MSEMEFLKENLLNTTTMVSVDSNTSTAQYLFDRNIELGYTSDGYGTNTATTITVTFDETTSVSHILLQNHNIKSYNVYYDTATAANSLASDTTNSDTSTYISFSTVSAANIKIVLNQAMTADTEKTIGELVITERLLSFNRNPSAQGYNPLRARRQVRHEMPDGGVVLYNVKDKQKAKINLKYITPSFHNSLDAIHASKDGLYFVPFPTTTSWDGKAFSMVWPGDFDFKYGDNAKTTYSGNILLEETISG